MLENITWNDNMTKVEKLQIKNFIFVSQALINIIIYRAATKDINFGSKPVEPKTKMLSQKSFYDPSELKRIYFDLEITQNKLT